MAASSQKLELLRLSLRDRIDELPKNSLLKEELVQELEAANSDCIHRTSQPTNRLARPAALTGQFLAPPSHSQQIIFIFIRLVFVPYLARLCSWCYC